MNAGVPPAGLLLLLALPAAAQVPAELDASQVALQALAGAVSTAYALLEEQAAPQGVIGAEGCVLWQQPGVALVPGAVWLPGRPARELLWLDPQRPAGLLREAHRFIRGEPPAPREEDYAQGRELPPQVYLLDRGLAHDRLLRYFANYCTWRELGGDEAPAALTKAELLVEAAVIFSSPGGPLEFYFAYDAGGKLRLRHIVSYDYFSA